jgi:hypothetical protein
MKRWIATPEELGVDLIRVRAAHATLAPVPCDHRIAFHDSDQDAVKVLTPAPRFIAALMAGGYIRHLRCVGACEITGAPILEGSGDLMAPMSYEDAVAFTAWKDLPAGTNRFAFIHIDELPTIAGDIDKARKFRAAWRLEEAA